MGDADTTRRSNQFLQVTNVDQVTNVLDALDEDLTNLHDTVHDLEQRTLRAVFSLAELFELAVQLDGYRDFRRFFLAMNLIILPLVFAAGLGYSLQEMVFPCGAEEMVQNAIMMMLCIAGSLGIPLYLGTLWAIYSFRVSEEISEEVTYELMEQMLSDNEVNSALEEESEGEAEASDSVTAMRGTESNETIRWRNQDIDSESESKSPSDEVRTAKKVAYLFPSEAEMNEANESIKKPTYSSNVDCETKSHQIIHGNAVETDGVAEIH